VTWLLQSKKNYVSTYMIGTLYAGLGENTKAFQFLEKAYQERSPDLPYFLKADLRIDSSHSDARFQGPYAPGRNSAVNSTTTQQPTIPNIRGSERKPSHNNSP